jgi:hypothetical protein
MLVIGLALNVSACGNSSSPTAPSAAPTVVSIAVTGGLTLSASGQTSQLSANAAFSNGTTQSVTSLAAWQSSNTGVVNVSSSGLLTAVGNGSATVTATYQGISGTAQVTVTISPSVGGVWNGVFADATFGNLASTWTVQQNGTTVTGTFTLGAALATAQGTLQGSIASSGLTTTLSIVAGGFPAPFQQCTTTITATLQIETSRMVGPYTLTTGSACTPPSATTSGTVTMIR